MKSRAGPLNSSMGTPATDRNMPAAAVPDSSIVDCCVKPSGAYSPTSPSFGPRTATLSLITCAPFSSMRPPRNTASAPVDLIFWNCDVVARRLRVPGLEARDLDPEGLRRLARRRRDTEAVGLLVVQDVDALDALRLHELGHRGALVGVVRHDARVVARPRRVVLVGLGRVTAARQVHRQAGIRVGRRDHRDPALGRLVDDRDDDRRAPRVEGAEDADHLVVRRVRVAVR